MNETLATSQWIDAGTADEIRVDEPKLVRSGTHQILVVRGEDDNVYAIDNRCPHEGYPLRQGYVRGCTLTCPWHNYKFDLRSGACLVGDEGVRRFPVRLTDGRVHLDISQGDPAAVIAERMLRLEGALSERRLGQIAREVTRLLQLGVDAARLAGIAARFDAQRAEYGSSHALAVAADVLDHLPRHPGTRAVLPLMQAMELASEAGVRRPPHAGAPGIDPGDDAVAAGQRFANAVEAEDGKVAEGLVRGALARGWSRSELEPWFLAAVSAHFLNFGHGLIYVVKGFDLLERTGWEYAADILSGLLRSIVLGTREDTLPRWKWIGDVISRYEPRFEQWWTQNEGVPRGVEAGSANAAAVEACIEALVHGSREDVETALVATLTGGVGFEAICDALVAAASQRLLRFDVAHDADTTVQDGWLDVTHCLTTASALRQALRRQPGPGAIRLVFFVARFIHNAAALDRQQSGQQTAPTHRPSGDSAIGFDTDELLSLVAKRRADAALCWLDDLWNRGPTPQEFAALRNMADDLALSDVYVRPIVCAHALKLARIAFDEAGVMAGTTWARWPVLAFFRFAASPIRERSVTRLAHEAQRLLVDGHVPRTLT